MRKAATSGERGAESGALLADDEWRRVLLEVWPTLNKSVQQQIMLLVG